jgi:PAS domain S-box-containing protein
VSTSSGRAGSVSVETDESADSHLRAVLESQPVTLVRLAKDGTFLAVNEAGLAVLNAERLDQVLGTSFLKLLPEEERPNVSVFIERVISGHRGSIEVDLTGLTGTRHTMQLHASPHPGAPDGIDSVLATVRDITEARRLEQSLVESMARQAELAAAHDAEQARLTAALNEVRQAQTDGAASAGQLSELEKQLHQALEERAAVTKRNAAEIEGLTEALEERTRISEEQSARLAQYAELEKALKSEASELAGRHEALSADLDVLRKEYDLLQKSAGASGAEREALRAQLEKGQADVAQAQADVQVLKDALNEAMAEQGRLAETVGAHEGAVTEAQARISELERALSAAQEQAAGKAADLESQLGTARQEMEGLAQSRRLGEAALNARIGSLEGELKVLRQAERDAVTRLNVLSEVAQRIAREMTEAAANAELAAAPGFTVGALAGRIEKPIGDVLGSGISVAVLVASPDTSVHASIERVEHALIALAVNRGAAMRGGQVALEFADVDVDDGAARARGGMQPGEYVLLAAHVIGEGAADGLPGDLFETGDPARWEHADAGLSSAYDSVRAFGGNLWLSKEGPTGVVFEMYLPSGGKR